MIITNKRVARVGYFITSYPTRAHRIIVIYYFFGPIRNSVRLLYFDKDSVITNAQMRMVCRVFTKFRMKNFFKHTADKRQKLDKLLKCVFFFLSIICCRGIFLFLRVRLRERSLIFTNCKVQIFFTVCL